MSKLLKQTRENIIEVIVKLDTLMDDDQLFEQIGQDLREIQIHAKTAKKELDAAREELDKAKDRIASLLNL